MKKYTAVSFLLIAVYLAIQPWYFPKACTAQPPELQLRLATTTSTVDTGLLDVLLREFESMYGIKVHVIPTGTGKAIKLGESGDVDCILVHAREAEDAFLAAGHGVNPLDVMHNDFIIAGPANDPAGVKNAGSAIEAMKSIASKKAAFVSRGDESGTHICEKKLWSDANFAEFGKWYLETGQGMGATLTLANEKQAYTLCDRATFLAFQDKIELKLLFEGDAKLRNPYRVIAISPVSHPDTKYVEAMAFAGFLTSREGQKLIAEFRKSGRILFHPDFIREP